MIEIGIGARDRLKRLEIRWPSGIRFQLDDVACDRAWLAIEGATNLIQSSPAE